MLRRAVPYVLCARFVASYPNGECDLDALENFVTLSIVDSRRAIAIAEAAWLIGATRDALKPPLSLADIAAVSEDLDVIFDRFTDPQSGKSVGEVVRVANAQAMQVVDSLLQIDPAMFENSQLGILVSLRRRPEGGDDGTPEPDSDDEIPEGKSAFERMMQLGSEAAPPLPPAGATRLAETGHDRLDPALTREQRTAETMKRMQHSISKLSPEMRQLAVQEDKTLPAEQVRVTLVRPHAPFPACAAQPRHEPAVPIHCCRPSRCWRR